MLVANAVTNVEKHLLFFRAVTKLLPSWFGSGHCKMWCRAAGSTSHDPGCMALQGAPGLALCASLAADLNGNGGKKGQKWQEIVAGIQDLTLFY